MKSISEIIEMKSTYTTRINNTARSIHSKLLSHLSFKDLYDESLMDNNLLTRYNNEVEPIIEEYKKELSTSVYEYLLNFLNDVSYIISPIGYNLDTGEEVTEASKEIFEINFIPAFEIETIWEEVLNIRYSYYPRPFWVITGYNISKNGEIISVSSGKSPRDFLLSNRDKFNKANVKSNYENLVQAIKNKDELFDYEICVEGILAQSDFNIPTTLHEAVRRHMILKELMENESILNDHMYYSRFSEDGKTVQLIDSGYGYSSCS